MSRRAGKVLQRSCGGGTCTACDDCKKKKLQRSANGAARSTEVPPIVHEVLRTSGTPLDRDTRASLEPFFAGKTLLPVSVGSSLSIGVPDSLHEREAARVADSASRSSAPPARPAAVDFGAIRVHTDARAAESARAVSARAYTVGTHIVFDSGAYAPRSASGRQLLAHELTHAMQQEGELRRSLIVTGPKRRRAADIDAINGWLENLCSDGGWEINDKGVLQQRKDALATAAAKHPRSCGCLSALIAPGAPVVRLRRRGAVGSWLMENLGGRYGATGGGQGDNPWEVSISRKEGHEHSGVGDPESSSETKQPPPKAGEEVGTVRTPTWLVFAHEVCGHVFKDKTGPAAHHAATESGDETTMDVENAIRGEHGLGENLGGFGESVQQASRPGSYYTTTGGETLAAILGRTAIDPGWHPHVARLDPGDPTFTKDVTGTKVTKFSAGEQLLIEGIFWHHVTQDNETATTIAAMWSKAGSGPIDIKRLKCANRLIPWGTDAEELPVPKGSKILIPHAERCTSGKRKQTTAPCAPAKLKAK